MHVLQIENSNPPEYLVWQTPAIRDQVTLVSYNLQEARVWRTRKAALQFFRLNYQTMPERLTPVKVELKIA